VLFNDFKIVCALYNLTFSPSVTDYELEKDIAYRMLEQSNQPNLLQILIKTENLNARHSNFKSIEDSIDFPKLDLNNLYHYICDSYQIRMASRYYYDHLNSDGNFYCQIAKVVRSPINCRVHNCGCKVGSKVNVAHMSL